MSAHRRSDSSVGMQKAPRRKSNKKESSSRASGKVTRRSKTNSMSIADPLLTASIASTDPDWHDDEKDQEDVVKPITKLEEELLNTFVDIEERLGKKIILTRKFFQRNMPAQTKRLDNKINFSRSNIGPVETEHLSRFLTERPIYSVIDFSYNMIGNEGIEYISTWISSPALMEEIIEEQENDDENIDEDEGDDDDEGMMVSLFGSLNEKETKTTSSQQVRLDLRANNITSDGLTKLFNSMSTCTFIKSLDISSVVGWEKNAYDDIASESLAKMLQTNRRLQELHLCRVQSVKNTGFEIFSIPNLLKKSVLMKLDVSQNELSDRICASIITQVNNSRIKYLNIGGNTIGTHSTDSLRLLITTSSTISTLDLTNCNISTTGSTKTTDSSGIPFLQVLIESIRHAPSLKKLVLDKNPLYDRSLEYIKDFILAAKKSKLYSLSLAGCVLRDISVLMEGVKENMKLNRLNLSKNNIGKEGVEAIVQAIGNQKPITIKDANNEEITLTGVSHLYLNQATLSDEEAIRLVNMLKINTCLHTIGMCNNNITNTTVEYFLNMRRTQDLCIERIELYNNAISEDILERLMTSLLEAGFGNSKKLLLRELRQLQRWMIMHATHSEKWYIAEGIKRQALSEELAIKCEENRKQLDGLYISEEDEFIKLENQLVETIVTKTKTLQSMQDDEREIDTIFKSKFAAIKDSTNKLQRKVKDVVESYTQPKRELRSWQLKLGSMESKAGIAHVKNALDNLTQGLHMNQKLIELEKEKLQEFLGMITRIQMRQNWKIAIKLVMKHIEKSKERKRKKLEQAKRLKKASLSKKNVHSNGNELWNNHMNDVDNDYYMQDYTSNNNDNNDNNDNSKLESIKRKSDRRKSKRKTMKLSKKILIKSKKSQEELAQPSEEQPLSEIQSTTTTTTITTTITTTSENNNNNQVIDSAFAHVPHFDTNQYMLASEHQEEHVLSDSDFWADPLDNDEEKEEYSFQRAKWIEDDLTCAETIHGKKIVTIREDNNDNNIIDNDDNDDDNNDNNIIDNDDNDDDNNDNNIIDNDDNDNDDDNNDDDNNDDDNNDLFIAPIDTSFNENPSNNSGVLRRKQYSLPSDSEPISSNKKYSKTASHKSSKTPTNKSKSKKSKNKLSTSTLKTSDTRQKELLKERKRLQQMRKSMDEAGFHELVDLNKEEELGQVMAEILQENEQTKAIKEYLIQSKKIKELEGKQENEVRLSLIKLRNSKKNKHDNDDNDDDDNDDDTDDDDNDDKKSTRKNKNNDEQSSSTTTQGIKTNRRRTLPAKPHRKIDKKTSRKKSSKKNSLKKKEAISTQVLVKQGEGNRISTPNEAVFSGFADRSHIRSRENQERKRAIDSQSREIDLGGIIISAWRKTNNNDDDDKFKKDNRIWNRRVQSSDSIHISTPTFRQYHKQSQQEREMPSVQKAEERRAYTSGSLGYKLSMFDEIPGVTLNNINNIDNNIDNNMNKHDQSTDNSTKQISISQPSLDNNHNNHHKLSLSGTPLTSTKEESNDWLNASSFLTSNGNNASKKQLQNKQQTKQYNRYNRRYSLNDHMEDNDSIKPSSWFRDSSSPKFAKNDSRQVLQLHDNDNNDNNDDDDSNYRPRFEAKMDYKKELYKQKYGNEAYNRFEAKKDRWQKVVHQKQSEFEEKRNQWTQIKLTEEENQQKFRKKQCKNKSKERRAYQNETSSSTFSVDYDKQGRLILQLSETEWHNKHIKNANMIKEEGQVMIKPPLSISSKHQLLKEDLAKKQSLLDRKMKQILSSPSRKLKDHNNKNILSLIIPKPELLKNSSITSRELINIDKYDGRMRDSVKAHVKRLLNPTPKGKLLIAHDVSAVYNDDNNNMNDITSTNSSSFSLFSKLDAFPIEERVMYRHNIIDNDDVPVKKADCIHCDSGNSHRICCFPISNMVVKGEKSLYV